MWVTIPYISQSSVLVLWIATLDQLEYLAECEHVGYSIFRGLGGIACLLFCTFCFKLQFFSKGSTVCWYNVLHRVPVELLYWWWPISAGRGVPVLQQRSTKLIMVKRSPVPWCPHYLFHGFHSRFHFSITLRVMWCWNLVGEFPLLSKLMEHVWGELGPTIWPYNVGDGGVAEWLA